MAFQRKKPAPIRIKAPLPGLIEPALATGISKVPTGDRWIHEVKFEVTGSRRIWPTKPSGFSPAAATTGPTALRKSLPMLS
jgi:hypothetical protein